MRRIFGCLQYRWENEEKSNSKPQMCLDFDFSTQLVFYSCFQQLTFEQHLSTLRPKEENGFVEPLEQRCTSCSFLLPWRHFQIFLSPKVFRSQSQPAVQCKSCAKGANKQKVVASGEARDPLQHQTFELKLSLKRPNISPVDGRNESDLVADRPGAFSFSETASILYVLFFKFCFFLFMTGQGMHFGKQQNRNCNEQQVLMKHWRD